MPDHGLCKTSILKWNYMMGVWKSCEAPGSLLTTYLDSIKYFDELDPNKRERSESNVEVLSIE